LVDEIERLRGEVVHLQDQLSELRSRFPSE
jgi:hypothetical protein